MSNPQTFDPQKNTDLMTYIQVKLQSLNRKKTQSENNLNTLKSKLDIVSGAQKDALIKKIELEKTIIYQFEIFIGIHNHLLNYAKNLEELIKNNQNLLTNPPLNHQMRVSFYTLYHNMKALLLTLNSLCESGLGGQKHYLNFVSNPGNLAVQPRNGDEVFSIGTAVQKFTAKEAIDMKEGSGNISNRTYISDIRLRRESSSEGQASIRIFIRDKAQTPDNVISLRIDFHQSSSNSQHFRVTMDLEYPSIESVFPRNDVSKKTAPTDWKNTSPFNKIVPILYRNLGEGDDTYHSDLLIRQNPDPEPFAKFVDLCFDNLVS